MSSPSGSSGCCRRSRNRHLPGRWKKFGPIPKSTSNPITPGAHPRYRGAGQVVLSPNSPSKSPSASLKTDEPLKFTPIKGSEQPVGRRLGGVASARPSETMRLITSDLRTDMTRPTLCIAGHSLHAACAGRRCNRRALAPITPDQRREDVRKSARPRATQHALSVVRRLPMARRIT